jgi:HEAT repeat protein
LQPALEALRDGDALVRVQAVGVLGFLKLEETVPALKAAGADADPQVRRAAVSALAFSQAQAATNAIETALRDTDWMVREIAADTLGARPPREAMTNALIAALDDEFWQVRLKAVRSLGRMKAMEAARRIAASLRHFQVNLRKEAAAALGEIGDVSSRPHLEAAQDDPDPDVRKTVRWALKQLAS